MRRGMMGALFLAFAVMAMQPAHACEECKLKGKIHIGQTQVIGNGVAYAWVRVKDGKPTTVGITLTESALSGLPEEPPAGMVGMEYDLALPKEAAGTPFDHIGLNWNPKGHAPAGIYNVPHFDFHFYMITSQAQSRITARGEDVARCFKKPAAGVLPAGYITGPGTEEPGMGSHWADPTSPEFHGQPFTSTFIYCYYNGSVIAYEPMITRAFLESHPNVTQPIKLPAVTPKRGYYPSGYTVKYDPVRKEVVIELEGLTQR
ncbi:MAG TPA: DUF5602 domain-containing protein [Chthonomonadaceae bacterium]|nr:DUF5602 domain-containing protein [Chthonomonadaceae bacterium]